MKWPESLICSWDSYSMGPARLRPEEDEEERPCPGGLGVTRARSILPSLLDGRPFARALKGF